MSKDRRDANRTLLGYELTPRQDAIVNYLVPSLGACVLYILLIAVDVGVIFRHLKDNNHILGSLTLFIICVPAIVSFIIFDLYYGERSLEQWIKFDVKVLEHYFFPIWSMWRFAERIFWSIETVRAPDDKSIAEAVTAVTDPRFIELYVFLQSYLHSLPQVLLQLHVLVRHNSDINTQTANVQIMSIVLNILKISVTTTYYQRFKSQMLWSKRNRSAKDERVSEKLEPFDDEDLPRYSAIRRRSSDLYMDPLDLELDEPVPVPVAGPSGLSNRQTLLETDLDQEVQARITVQEEEGFDETDALLHDRASGSGSQLFQETDLSNGSKPVKGLKDDDLAVKLITILWWFTFLLARVLTISVFDYFYTEETFYLIKFHFSVMVGILYYEVYTNEVMRQNPKAMFFLFMAFVYVFCIIEFKIKFNRPTVIFGGFFILVFLENIVMCLVWYFTQIESLENDFWFRSVFYIIIACLFLSISALLFYFVMNKPKKVGNRFYV